MWVLPLNLAQPDWVQAKWGEALSRVAAVLLALDLALLLHAPAAGVVTAGAAFTVGLVMNRRLAGSSFHAMMATTFFMALSAWAGTLSGQVEVVNLLAVAAWGTGFALLTIHDEDAGWIAMQGNIALVIASAFPGANLAALERALAVVIGGLLQIMIVALTNGLLLRFAKKSPTPPAPKGPSVWAQLLASATAATAAWRYAVRLVVTLLIAVQTGRTLHLANSYWLPMTTLIILKPDFFRTYSGAVQRVLGTLAGVAVASLIAHAFQPTTVWLILLVGLFSFGSFYLVRVHPILFAASLTAYIIFQVAFTGIPERQVTGDRLLLTILGSGLALASRAVGYRLVACFLPPGWRQPASERPRPDPAST